MLPWQHARHVQSRVRKHNYVSHMYELALAVIDLCASKDGPVAAITRDDTGFEHCAYIR